MKVLITGISGKLGRTVALTLADSGHKVIGIDSRPWPDAPPGITAHAQDIRKRPAEDIFRTERPDAVVHMGTVTYLTQSAELRHRINLDGTKAVFRYCAKYGTRQAVFVGRHTYYGATPDAPLYHVETDPPLSITNFPELADLVAADLYAVSALWSVPNLDTAVLRMCYTLGPSQHGTLAAYFAGERVPTVLGFDPMFQFVHDLDAAAAIGAAVESRIRGVFNVAGPQPVPLSLLIKVCGRKRVPLPEFLLTKALGQLGLPALPPGAITHVKYPILVDDRPFREATGFEPIYDESQTMEAFRWA